MALLTITTPEVESRIRLIDKDDNVLIDDEVIYIDHILSLSQRDVDLRDEESVFDWLPDFTQRLNKRYDLELTETNAFYIAKEAARLMWELKKKYDIKLKWQQPME
tara:strand:+ start:6846 stop:7163 length:318 start_codon:yes stop_codon:yes gene_type:complete